MVVTRGRWAGGAVMTVSRVAAGRRGWGSVVMVMAVRARWPVWGVTCSIHLWEKWRLVTDSSYIISRKKLSKMISTWERTIPRNYLINAKARQSELCTQRLKEDVPPIMYSLYFTTVHNNIFQPTPTTIVQSHFLQCQYAKINKQLISRAVRITTNLYYYYM